MQSRRIFSLGTFLCCLVSQAAADMVAEPKCDDPAGYRLVENVISVDRYECDTAGVCSVSLKAPLAVDEREFLGFVLLFSEGRQGMLDLAYTKDEQNEYTYAGFELPRPYFRTVSVRAVYQFKTHCYLESTWTASNATPGSAK